MPDGGMFFILILGGLAVSVCNCLAGIVSGNAFDFLDDSFLHSIIGQCQH